MKNKLFNLNYEKYHETILNDNFWHYENNDSNYINHFGILIKHKLRKIKSNQFGIYLLKEVKLWKTNYLISKK